MCLIFVNVLNARVIYNTECNSNSEVLNTLKGYYQAALMQNQEVDKRKLENLSIYSKKVSNVANESNLCVYYIDPSDLGLKVQSSNLYFFSDNTYLFPTVLTVKDGIDMKAYMFSKLEKFSFDDYKGIKIKTNDSNAKSNNKIVLFLSLECPHCANVYSYLHYYLIQARNNISALKNEIAPFDLIVFLSSNDVNKVKFFKALHDSDLDIGNILFDYYNNQDLMRSNADKVIRHYYDTYLKQSESFKSSDDVISFAQKANISDMNSEFNRLETNGVPVIFINNKPVIGANTSVINLLLKEDSIADLEEINNIINSYNEQIKKESESKSNQE
jgi:glutaredoxin